MMEGYILLHRSLSLNDLWFSEPFTKGQAWVDMLMLANHKDGYFFVRGHKIEVARGQLGWSEVKLATRWKWSRNKIRNFLKHLEKEQQIKQHKNNVTSLITIINYDSYQTQKTAKKTAESTAEGQQKDSRRTAEGTLTNNDNKDINIYTSFFESFWQVFPRKEPKKKAFQIWQRKKLDDNLDQIIRHVKKKIASGDWDKRQFTPMASTYLEQERWIGNEDEKEDDWMKGIQV